MDDSTTHSTNRRKRQVSECDGELCEFMPLSKRINNLHINGNLNPVNQETQGQGVRYTSPCECRLQPSTSKNVVQCSLCNPNLCGISQHVLPDVVNIPQVRSEQTRGTSTEVERSPIYDPDMDVDMNPHYYDPNKLLFSLHIERVKRHGLLFKPNKYDG